MKRVCLIFMVFLAFALKTSAAEEKKIVRVGISDQTFTVFEHTKTDFVSTGELMVVDLAGPGGAYKLPKGSVVHIEAQDSRFNIMSDNRLIFESSQGPIVLTSAGQVGIANLNRKGIPALYNGQIELKMLKNGKYNIINVLDMQSYLRGVVPNEMPVSFGLEALKAQAVAARNYANRPQSAYANYDVCDSTACQVYSGANSYSPLSDKAVEQTLGLYALFQNEPILALYSSTAGGITESYENTFGENGLFSPPVILPYLKAVGDNKSFQILKTEDDVREFYSKSPQTNDIKSSYYRWKVEWTKGELEEILNKTLYEQSQKGFVEPAFDSNCFLEGLESIKVLQRGDSGKALLVEIVSRSGKWRVRKELAIRRVFQKTGKALPSANFFVDTENDNNASSFVKAIFDTQGELTKIVFTGGGFGHGVGMSQYGAGFMASKGSSFDDILRHYYTGITLGTIPLNIDTNNKIYKINFAAQEGRKYLLKFDNTKRLTRFDFSINSIDFTPNMSVFDAKILYFDITKYLNPGPNEIVVNPLVARDKGKNTRVWVEIAEK